MRSTRLKSFEQEAHDILSQLRSSPKTRKGLEEVWGAFPGGKAEGAKQASGENVREISSGKSWPKTEHKTMVSNFNVETWTV